MDWFTQLWLGTLVFVSAGFPGVLPEAQPAETAGRTVAANAPAPFPEKRSSAVEPVVEAGSALLVDLESGHELYAKDPASQRPIASISKLMTALIATERLTPGQEVVAPELSNSPEESLMGLEKGDRLRADDVLAGALITSGNDAAETLAHAVSGSEDEFVEVMNERAHALGMQETRFFNASGYAKGENVSSARDLVILSQAVLQEPRIRAVVADTERTVRALNARKPTPENPSPERTEFRLFSTDLLLDSYLPIAGLKTGTSDAAGPSLVNVLERGDRRLLAIVLDSPDRFQENKAMLDWALRSFKW
ncbi:MAG: D-alanyl-D-alanine carboxypeptidase [bacterium]|nr:D-alanyl-D-alanine carboxypeptidase [bacterium]